MPGLFNDWQAIWGRIQGDINAQTDLMQLLGYNQNIKVVLGANGTITIPAGYVINNLVIYNGTANAVTGGINIGTAALGAQVVSAEQVGANALKKVADANMLKSIFSLTTDTVLHISTVTSWNSASVTFFFNISSLTELP